jgi:hypothetical protein
MELFEDFKEKFDRLIESKGINAHVFNDMLFNAGALVAGSFTLQAYLLGKMDTSNWGSDIDIWIAYNNEDAFLNLIKQLFDLGFGLPRRINHAVDDSPYLRLREEIYSIHGTENRITDAKIQIIRTKADPMASIRNFDIRLCCLAYNGREIVSDDYKFTNNIVKDIELRVITSNTKQSLYDWKRTFSRMLKYVRRGFTKINASSVVEGLNWSIHRPDRDRHEVGSRRYPEVKTPTWKDILGVACSWNDRRRSEHALPDFRFNVAENKLYFGIPGRMEALNTSHLPYLGYINFRNLELDCNLSLNNLFNDSPSFHVANIEYTPDDQEIPNNCMFAQIMMATRRNALNVRNRQIMTEVYNFLFTSVFGLIQHNFRAEALTILYAWNYFATTFNRDHPGAEVPIFIVTNKEILLGIENTGQLLRAEGAENVDIELMFDDKKESPNISRQLIDYGKLCYDPFSGDDEKTILAAIHDGKIIFHILGVDLPRTGPPHILHEAFNKYMDAERTVIWERDSSVFLPCTDQAENANALLNQGMYVLLRLDVLYPIHLNDLYNALFWYYRGIRQFALIPTDKQFSRTTSMGAAFMAIADRLRLFRLSFWRDENEINMGEVGQHHCGEGTAKTIYDLVPIHGPEEFKVSPQLMNEGEEENVRLPELKASFPDKLISILNRLHVYLPEEKFADNLPDENYILRLLKSLDRELYTQIHNNRTINNEMEYRRLLVDCVKLLTVNYDIETLQNKNLFQLYLIVHNLIDVVYPRIFHKIFQFNDMEDIELGQDEEGVVVGPNVIPIDPHLLDIYRESPPRIRIEEVRANDLDRPILDIYRESPPRIRIEEVRANDLDSPRENRLMPRMSPFALNRNRINVRRPSPIRIGEVKQREEKVNNRNRIGNKYDDSDNESEFSEYSNYSPNNEINVLLTPDTPDLDNPDYENFEELDYENLEERKEEREKRS